MNHAVCTYSMQNIALRCAVLYCAVLWYAVLYCTVLCCNVQLHATGLNEGNCVALRNLSGRDMTDRLPVLLQPPIVDQGMTSKTFNI